MLKTDSSGVIQWDRTFGGTGGESGACIRQTLDNGYIMVGSTGSFGEGYSSIYVIRTDVNGDSVWAATYGGNKADFGYSVEILTDGSFVFSGASSSFGLGYADAYLFRTDENGILQWQEVYGGSKDDRAYAVQPTGDGGFVLAGTTESSGNGKIDCYVVKTNPLGEAIWKRTYGGGNSDFCRNIITERNSFCLIGHSFSYSAGGSDVYVLKATGEQMTAVDDSKNSALPEDYFLSQNYPNPFNMSTTIEFSLERGAPANLTIYNVLGQEITRWTFSYAPAGTSAVMWNGCDNSGQEVASGIYFYRFETTDLSLTKKMVLLK
jgi:hypothetical protein